MTKQFLDKANRGKFAMNPYHNQDVAFFDARLISRQFPTAKVLVAGISLPINPSYWLMINAASHWADSQSFLNGRLVGES